jgi:hypothetical protein
MQHFISFFLKFKSSLLVKRDFLLIADFAMTILDERSSRELKGYYETSLTNTIFITNIVAWKMYIIKVGN